MISLKEYIKEAILSDIDDTLSKSDDYVAHQEQLKQELDIIKTLKPKQFTTDKNDDIGITIYSYTWKCPAVIKEYLSKHESKIGALEIVIQVESIDRINRTNHGCKSYECWAPAIYALDLKCKNAISDAAEIISPIVKETSPAKVLSKMVQYVNKLGSPGSQDNIKDILKHLNNMVGWWRN